MKGQIHPCIFSASRQNFIVKGFPKPFEKGFYKVEIMFQYIKGEACIIWIQEVPFYTLSLRSPWGLSTFPLLSSPLLMSS